MKSVLIVDDHPIFRNGLKLIFSYEFEMKVEEVSCGLDALQTIAASKPDLVIMDIDLPDIDGLETISRIIKSHAKLPIIVVSALKEKEYAYRAMNAGASAYIHKESDKHKFVAAVRDVFRGTGDIRRKPNMDPDHPEERDDGLYRSLSNREYQIFCLFAMGRTPATIALELGISRKTVSAQRARILSKLKLDNNAEMMHYALKNGLVKIQ